MPSAAYRRWRGDRASDLKEIAEAHAAVRRSGRGRKLATQQLKRAYVVLIASQFQGYCRDLHSECAGILADIVAPDSLRTIFRSRLTQGRRLDRGNAEPSSIQEDFSRFGLRFWEEVEGSREGNRALKSELSGLNDWRNAIAHQDFDPIKLGGSAQLAMGRVQGWRRTCGILARSFDEVMRAHLQMLTLAEPW